MRKCGSRVRGTLAGLLSLSWLLVAAGARGALPEDCENLGAALVDHSCFHSKYGPFVAVPATSAGAELSNMPNVDPVHTEYRIGLAGEGSYVTYSPKRKGSWSVFLGEDVPFRLFEVHEDEVTSVATIGDELTSVLTIEDGHTGCEALPVARVFELDQDDKFSKRYVLEFGGTLSREVVAVIEYVDDFLTELGRDADSDGYGDPDDTVTTSCVPPDGYAPNASDCDDGDPDINPGRAEQCDGVDQNCNGVADDVGLSCWSGEHTCRATGQWICAEGAETATCDAVAGEGSNETCNGVDDDCDGDIDEDQGLCPDEDRPACVRHEQTASCGCQLDQDCGPPDSGRICDTARKLCVSGCSEAPGRNACPAGFECGVTDAAGSSCEPVEEPNAGGSAGDSSSGDEELAPLDSGNSDCSCAVPGSPRDPSGVALLVVVGGVLALRARRRSSRAPRASLPSHAAVWLALLFAPSLISCGGKAESDAGPGDPAGVPAQCEPVLEEKPVRHTCTHTTNGPFVDVVSSSNEATAGDVSDLHRTFVVDNLGAGSFVRYRAYRDGEHVLFSDRPTDLRVLDPEGEAVPGAWFQVEGCKTIEAARSAVFEQGKSYLFELEDAEPVRFNLFIEHLGAFRDPWSRECPQ
jgi:MYXO-CTERM domain-containing protein